MKIEIGKNNERSKNVCPKGVDFLPLLLTYMPFTIILNTQEAANFFC
jgi:hypothetical protein